MPSPPQLADNDGHTFNGNDVVRELTRMKALFQLRTLETIITGEATGRTSLTTSPAHPPPAAGLTPSERDPGASESGPPHGRTELPGGGPQPFICSQSQHATPTTGMP